MGRFSGKKKMKLISEQQIDLMKVDPASLDLVLCACGYETRATYVASKLGQDTTCQKVALAFEDRSALARKKNEDEFTELGYELVRTSGGTADSAEAVCNTMLSEPDRKHVRILVDYSCMTRVWYAALIDRLHRIRIGPDAEVIFAYSPSTHTPPPRTPAPNASIGS